MGFFDNLKKKFGTKKKRWKRIYYDRRDSDTRYHGHR